MGDVHHCLIPELAPAFALLLAAAVTICIMQTYSFHISLLELLVWKFGEARSPNLPCLAQWIRSQCIRMHFNISATEPAPPTA